MIRKITLLLCLSFGFIPSFAQDNFPVNGVRDDRTNSYAFTNATIYVNHNTKLEDATLLIREGEIQNVGNGITVPKGYVVINMKGKYIYPSFIDPYTSYGLPAAKKPDPFNWSAAEKITPQKEGAYNANDAIRANYKASKEFHIKKFDAKALREIGFGSVLSFMSDGIVRGSSTLVTLSEGNDNEAILSEAVAAHYSFDKGSSSQSYPNSIMGYVALIRQTYFDARWYKNTKPFTDLTLDAFNQQQGLPQIIEANNNLNIFRSDRVGDEFGVQYIIKGSGREYQRINEIKATNASFIIPVEYPKAYDVDDPIETLNVTLAQMKHWELAPTNLSALANNNVTFALTSAGLKDKKNFLKNIKKAIDNGLSEQKALEALTSTPASMLQVSDRLGSLSKGKVANFLITSGNIFEKETKIYDNWVQGIRYAVTAEESDEQLAGKYKFTVGSDSFDMNIKGEPGKYKFSIEINDSTSIDVKVTMKEDLITLTYKPQDEKNEVRLSGWKEGKSWKGEGQLVDGSWVSWTLVYQAELDKEEDNGDKEEKNEEEVDESMGKVIYPFLAYGIESLPIHEIILIKNATVWTNEEAGILTETDVLIEKGKISKVGKGITAKGAREIDGTGKHLTSGIIDEHSHIALSNVNDVATNSGMVRMRDAVNSEHINIYRQLAGGVTASQLLHGSANPVGGQSALIKLRWGSAPEDMLIKGSDAFIKFALGENVKRSWSSASIRYPQTRMGVEQVYVDAFTNALNYEKEWSVYNSLSSIVKANTPAPRKDLVHDTMLEIIRGKRFITCHSYVQSEINMLMKVAEQFGFRINTFTHILEGYKVADKMKAHGVGASTFSDWWAYKWEVRYAIPYNATLMHNEGVTVAINSDDAEMGRRLNQEAAKSVMYADMSEEDAWKMVTLNPAKLLHLDNRMGSIKVGKDGDVVLWSDHPLSIYAVAEKTLVDGKVYFDIERDREMRKEIEQERARLINKMKAAKNGGASTQKPKKEESHNWHCDDIVQVSDSSK